ncbi:MAG: histidine--tRNA ligase [Patescibacteria group bacterium]
MPKKPEERAKKQPQLLRGMRDILPEDQPYWNFIRTRVASVASAYSFGRIDCPILEEASLFIRSVGKDTDIVEKEMYTFEEKSGTPVTMRPEGTASICRAYIEHGMLNRPQPVKLYYVGPFFRYDRPQAGRYRQFYQFGFEALGDDHAVLDAQIMMLAYNLYAEAGIPVSLQVNSIGHPECRDGYRKALVDYYRTRKNALCEECKRRLLKNPLRLLDCKEPDCQVLAQDAPQTVDYLCEDCNKHFVTVLEHLDELDISYVLNTRLVRGLDYYSGTVFELWPETSEAGENQVKASSQSALGGGGRYDYLIESLGGQPTPAIGFSGGIERMIVELKRRQSDIGKGPLPDIFVAQLGDAARKKSLKLFEDLRRSSFKVAESFSKDGLKPQMEMAHKLGAKFALILGQKEIMDDTILIRDMESGIQETVHYAKASEEIKRRLEKYMVVHRDRVQEQEQTKEHNG